MIKNDTEGEKERAKTPHLHRLNEWCPLVMGGANRVGLVGGSKGRCVIEINTAESQQTFHGYLLHFLPPPN